MSEIMNQDAAGGNIFQHFAGLGNWIEELEQTIAQMRSLDVSLHEMLDILASFAGGLQHGLAVVQDGNVVWANEAGCRMVEYDLEEVANTPVVSLIHPDYRVKLAARMANIQAGDVLPTYDIWPFVTKSRVVRQVKTYADRIVFLGKPAILAILIDVTEEQKQQDELSLRAEMLDMVSESVFLLDTEGNILSVNRSAARVLGYTPDEIIKMNVLDINAPELRHRAGIRLKQVSEHKELRFKTVHLHKTGTRLPVVVKVKLIRWGGRKYMLGVVQEVTERPEDEI